MKRTYTLFSATSELLTCPEIYQHAKSRNLILTPHQTRTLSIVTPLERAPGCLQETYVNFDPAMIRLDGIELMYERGRLYITCTICAVELGESTLTLTIPKAHCVPIATRAATTN